MEKAKRKEYIHQWKNRHPEMGIIGIHATQTNELYLGLSMDTKADLNSNQFKLSSGIHRNKELQRLWNSQGQDAFSLSVIKSHQYKDLEEDQRDKLEKLLETCFEEYPEAKKI